MMIKQRRESRDRRGLKLQGLHEWMDDLRRERIFERDLLKEVKNSDSTSFEPVYNDPSWDAPLHDLRRRYIDSLENDVTRCQTPIPPSLISAITSARTYKIANKVREKQRESSGEILNITLRRRRKGPPPDVLSRMSPEQRKMDRIVRSSVSEVGYVGKIKKRMGRKLMDPEAWQVENYGGEAFDEKVERSSSK
ncbi:hypothetical protein ONZ45_g5336 [Pleurotus djamor]|nr:hypothetical protein ONZ45_g5336 [Pleurotus djamor]